VNQNFSTDKNLASEQRTLHTDEPPMFYDRMLGAAIIFP